MLQSFSEAYNVRGKEQVNRNCYPKSTSAAKKQPLKRFSEIAEWQENKKLVPEPCVFTTEKSCVQRSYTVIANITAKSLNFCLIKLVKEQSLTLRNNQLPDKTPRTYKGRFYKYKVTAREALLTI